MSLNVVIVSLGRLSGKQDCVCDKSDLQFSEEMEQNFIRCSSCWYSQMSQQVLAVAATGMLAHTDEQAGHLRPIFSACVKALGPHFAFVRGCVSALTLTLDHFSIAL